jgi:hypothetical protein
MLEPVLLIVDLHPNYLIMAHLVHRDRADGRHLVHRDRPDGVHQVPLDHTDG